MRIATNPKLLMENYVEATLKKVSGRKALESFVNSDDATEVTLMRTEAMIRDTFYAASSLQLSDEEISELYEAEQVAQYLDQLCQIKFAF